MPTPSANPDRSERVCPLCDNDGYVEVWNEEGDMIVATHECPRLLSDGHAPFNATGILDASATVGDLDSEKYEADDA